MLDVFISYSRRNLDYVNILTNSLEIQGKSIWFDQKKEPLAGIPAGSLWWKQIQYGIDTADNFLMIISPDSMKSPYCHAEIAHALKQNKRIVTLLYCGDLTSYKTINTITDTINAIPDEAQIPEAVSADIQMVRLLARRNWLELSKIQFVVYSQVSNWDQWLRTLLDAIDLDIQWVRMWSQFQQAVQIWVETDYDDMYLWLEPRLKLIRDAIESREQPLTNDEQLFIEPEQKRLLRELDNINTTHERRRDIGDRLAIIGDTRHGVGVKNSLPDIVWLPVKGSSGKYKFDFGEFEVQDFFIAKYPVTHQQYQIFVDREYENDRWWQDAPYHYHRPNKAAGSTYRVANAPRNHISWYQSMAFARWLDAEYHSLGLFEKLNICSFDGSYVKKDNISTKLNPDTWQIRLPLEWEWQWAAQDGGNEFVYPWGFPHNNYSYTGKNDPEVLSYGYDDMDGYANTRDAGLRRPISVGMYPWNHAIGCGALDMTGNLKEWCINEPSNSETWMSKPKPQRGGSFYTDSHNSRTYAQDSGEAGRAYDECGMRLVIAQKL